MSVKKQLFHSELTTRTQNEGGVDLTVVSGITESKFPGKRPYITVMDHQNGMERFYETETDESADELVAWKGVRAMVFAAGSRETAAFSFEQLPDEDAPPARPAARAAAARPAPTRAAAAPAARPAARPAAAAPREPVQRLSKEEREAAEVAALRKAYKLGLKASVLMQALIPLVDNIAKAAASVGVIYTPEDFRATLNTLFIEVKGYTDVSALPSKLPAPATAATPPPPAPEPEPEPEPQPPPAEEEAEELDFIPF